MSFLARTTIAAKFSAITIRKFSEIPKVTIARNLARLQEIQEAKDENELKKILSSPLPAVNLKALSEEFSGLENYFGSSSSSATTVKAFVADKNAWQNKDFFAYAAQESVKPETYPFTIGFLFVIIVLGFGSQTLITEDIWKVSGYAKLLDKKNGIVRADDAHHAHDAAHH